jgi:RNA polymerase sigma-70 factor (ECF subfamily)
MQMVSDPDMLLRRARDGSEAALGELLTAYSPYLTVLARVQVGRRLQGKVEAGDIVQETYLDAHRQFPQFRGTTEAELICWLRRILAGQLALVIRKFAGTRARDVKLERELGDDLDRPASAMDRGLIAGTSTPSARASRREQAVLLAEALAKLPPDYREVICLRNLEGLGFSEVAARMSRTEDSVQKLWVRALAKLRGAMGETP